MQDKPYKYDIFISFATEDLEVAKNTAKRLKLHGLNVFISSETLKSKVGLNYVDEIFQSLEQSEHFLLVTSEFSLESDWVKEELSTFYNEIAIPSKHNRRILVFNYNPQYDVKKLPLYLRKQQVTNELDDILVSLGKSPDQASVDTDSNPEKPVKNKVKGKKEEPKKQDDSEPKPFDNILTVDMFLIIDNQEQYYNGTLSCFDDHWKFVAEGTTREISNVVDSRVMTYKQKEWIEVIHLNEGVRNYAYFADPVDQMKILKLSLLLKSNAATNPAVQREAKILEEERKLDQQQTRQQEQPQVSTTSFQRGNLIATYTDVYFRHLDERSVSFGVTKSSVQPGTFNVYSNAFEFISTEFNFTISFIYDIYFIAQNTEYVNNYMRVDFTENGEIYTMLFYRFSLFGDSPTQRMYNEIANLYHQGQLLFEGR